MINQWLLGMWSQGSLLCVLGLLSLPGCLHAQNRPPYHHHQHQQQYSLLETPEVIMPVMAADFPPYQQQIQANLPPLISYPPPPPNAAQVAKRTYALPPENFSPLMIPDDSFHSLNVLADRISKELAQNIPKPFTSILNLGPENPQELGIKPFTFFRQLLAYVSLPDDTRKFPSDVTERGKKILKALPGGSIGSYEDSQGNELIRRHVAEFLTERDDVQSNYTNIVLAGGAINMDRVIWTALSNFIQGKRVGVLVPTPLISYYTSQIKQWTECTMKYELDSQSRWGINWDSLRAAFDEGNDSLCSPSALLVVNPGNPTGHVFTRKELDTIIRFAYENHLIIIAHELFHDMIIDSQTEFVPVRRRISELGSPYSEMEVATIFSPSVSPMGEFGIAGGAIELLNFDPDVITYMVLIIGTTLSNYNIPGQVAVDVLVNPPKQGDPSYELYAKELSARRALWDANSKLIVDKLNEIPGYSCRSVDATVYAFPAVTMPNSLISEAQILKIQPDLLYAQKLLNATGIFVTPAAGYSNPICTNNYYFRICFHPKREVLEAALERLKAFHLSILDPKPEYCVA